MIRAVSTVGLLAASLCLGWLNLSWTRTPLDLSPLRAERASPTEWAKTGPEDPPPDLRAEMGETLARPLFHRTRRPFAPPPPPPVEAVFVEEEAPPIMEPEPVEMPPELALAGVSLAKSGNRALLGLLSGAEVRWYGLGEAIEGWRVETITEAAVVLADGDRRLTLPLYASGTGTQP